MMPADISIPRLAVIALVALVTTSSAVLPGGGAAARSGRIRIVFPFFGLR
jgi:hypothetical protein